MLKFFSLKMNYTCCGAVFKNMPPYLEHLKSHKDNSNLFIKCACGQTCVNWEAFKKHNLRYHKDDNPLEMLETYQTLVNNLFESESGREENASNNSFHVDDSLSSSKDENSLPRDDKENDFEKSKFLYAQYLLEMTYQYKLTAKTVDDFNTNTKKLVISFLDDFKLI